jgi:quercetin dioxygenase-like cupin family protein
MKRVSLAVAVLALVAFAGPAPAQDPTEVDAEHYTVEFENEHVRIVRIKYGPGEKSVMHEHPPAVAVFLSDGKAQFTLEDGSTVDAPVVAGTAQWEAAGKHLPANVGDAPFEVVLVELKVEAAE